ncbi:MAG: hypothetical protein WDZ49_09460 [Litorilinea sp.]
MNTVISNENAEPEQGILTVFDALPFEKQCEMYVMTTLLVEDLIIAEREKGWTPKKVDGE